MLSKLSNKYEVTMVNFKHNHEINADIYKNHPRQRRLDQDTQKKAFDMLACNSEVKLVADKLELETGKVILTKDLHNIRTKFKNQNHQKKSQTEVMQSVQKVVDERIKLDGADYFNFAQDPTQQELYIVYYQNKTMQELFNQYGELLFIDGTYNLNENNYSNYNIAVQDCNGNSQLVATSLVAYEREASLDAVLQFFSASQKK